jgi:hypothetical protein
MRTGSGWPRAGLALSPPRGRRGNDMEEPKTIEYILNQVKHQAVAMAETEDECERGYAHLGWMLLEVADMQYWRVQHETFRDYLRAVAMVSKKTAGQLHQYFLTVRDLSDTFSAAQLEAMGITKAIKLRAAKDYAIVLPQAVVLAALDPLVTVKDLKKIISEALNAPEDDGDWFDLGAEFYVSPEERATIEDAVRAAEHCEPATKKTISASMQRKDVVLKWCMEFLGTYSAES